MEMLGRKVALAGSTAPLAQTIEAFDAAIIGAALASAEDSQHAAIENIRIGNLWDSIEIYAALLAYTD